MNPVKPPTMLLFYEDGKPFNKEIVLHLFTQI